MTKIQWGGTYDNALGQISFNFTCSHMEALGILRMAEHAVIRQMTGGAPGHPQLPQGSPEEPVTTGVVRNPALQVRRL